ncbi:MAG: lysophospholipase [Candidatus Margulisbacteria bacterium]|nr:lysophospholipase [Candidatus Margulisiibacteriota bacterium]
MVELKYAKESNIHYRAWSAMQTKAVLLLVHGMGAHTDRWNFLADFFAAKGYSSYGLELKGFGHTPDRPRGHIDSLNIYYQDILKLLEIIKRENPGKKVFLLAESMGGLIAFMISCLYPDTFAGQILIAPAFANGMKIPISAYLTLVGLYLFNPKRTIDMPFTSAMCTRDVAYQKVMDNNPDEHRKASLRLLIEILFAQLKAPGLSKKLNIPTLFLIPGKDYLVDEKPGRKLFDKLTLKDKTKIEYPEMLHALSIEQDREKVFNDILGWLGKRA